MATLFNKEGSFFSYFAIDGSYGDAEGMVVADTLEWTDEEWNLIHECGDYHRGYVAELFENGASVEEAIKILELIENDDYIFMNAEIDLANLRNEG